MGRLLPGFLALLLCASFSNAWAGGTSAGKPMWEQSGDVLQWGIPLFGLGLSLLLRGGGEDGDWTFGPPPPASTLDSQASGLDFDWPGPGLGKSAQMDFLVSFLRMELTTYGLKYAIDAQRPNGGGQSFPSGHTAAAFMGAEYIRKECGPWWGVPAYAAATWVGYTRVQSKNHYWRDVFAGALIGIASNHDFGEFETDLGHFSVAPALVSSSDMAWVRAEPLDSLPMTLEEKLPVPGIRFEWRF